MAVLAEVEATPVVGNVGTGGNDDKCSRGGAGDMNAGRVCAACEGRGYIGVPTLTGLAMLLTLVGDTQAGTFSPSVAASFISTSSAASRGADGASMLAASGDIGDPHC